MIKTILTTAAIALTAAPVLAENVTSPFAVPTMTPKSVNFGFSSSVAASEVVPSMALSAVNIANNISCRSRARAKYFELGARDMSNDTSNAQWAIVGNMQAVVWCRDIQAVIAVAGSNYSAVAELRDELQKVF
jgi:hypothetical protein